MDRRKKLATAGAVSLTATAAVVALGASVGLFGLTDNSSRVGKLSPIDATHDDQLDDPGRQDDHRRRPAAGHAPEVPRATIAPAPDSERPRSNAGHEPADQHQDDRPPSTDGRPRPRSARRRPGETTDADDSQPLGRHAPDSIELRA